MSKRRRSAVEKPQENRVKRLIRTCLASDEARMGLPDTKSEMSLITTRIMCGVFAGLLLMSLAHSGVQPSAEYLGWIVMIGVATWATLVGVGSVWEREHQRTAQRIQQLAEQADEEDHNAVISKVDEEINDVCRSPDDREARRKLRNDSVRLYNADQEKFNRRIRKEIFKEDSGE